MADGDLRTQLTSATMRVDAGVSLPGEPELQVAVELLVPRDPLPLALVCVPGGAMNRRYFDLRAPAAPWSAHSRRRDASFPRSPADRRARR
jgi:hypothetical protein